MAKVNLEQLRIVGGRDWPSQPSSEAGMTLGSVAPVRKAQLYEEICSRIIEVIKAGTWTPGQKLPSERELAKAFGVSRPTLREALGALQVIGVVDTQHGSGSRITDNALDVLAQVPVEEYGLGVSPVALLEARLALEPIIASLAASRYKPDPEIENLLEMMDAARDWENPAHRMVWSEADIAFHRRIAVQVENPVFLSVADSIAMVMSEPLWRRLRDEMLTVPERIEASVQEHQRIFEAIRDRRPEDAHRYAHEHVQVVREYMGLV